MDWYVYMLRCEDGSLYTGIASDVEKRFAMHKSGHGAKYTRSHPPVAVVYREQCSDKGAELRREAAIKKLPRAKKLELTARGGRKALPRRARQDAGQAQRL